MNWPSKDPVDRFVGGGLMAVGGLMTLLCGTCTLFFLGFATVGEISTWHQGSLSESDRYTAAFAPAIAIGAVLLGGLPTAFGVVLFLAGRRRYWPKGAEPWPAPPADLSDE